MTLLDELIAKHTAGIPAVQLDYSDEFPQADAIAAECGSEEVRDILSRIERLAAERSIADESGTVNGDELDFMWSRFSRYASLLPHLVPRFSAIVISAITSHSSELRLYAAQAFKLAPVAEAVKPIQAQLSVEEVGPVRAVLQQALSNCKSKQSWVGRLLR